MSRHEGVSCDSCLIGNFRGKRYKCLICYDYDLCATCYEAGATTTRHTTEHAMQCILTRSDFDLYYGGEAISVEQPQAFTCPFCGKMGFTESSLQEHVNNEHSDTSFEVVCPVCAALPGGDPNLVTDDFATHLTLEHRSPRDLDEPSSSRHVRRIPHPGRGVGATRARRTNMHFSSSGGLASLSPSSRESMDPIAELLSQLSGVRRSGAASQSSTSSQLQQLQMQLQLERQQAQVARQHLERLPRRQAQIAGSVSGGGSGSSGQAAATSGAAVALQPTVVVEPSIAKSSSSSSQFLLARYAEPQFSENELQQIETDRADRSVFVRELLVNALVEGLSLGAASTCATKSTPVMDEGSSVNSHPIRDMETPASSVPPQMQAISRATGTTVTKKSQGSAHARVVTRNGNGPAPVRDQPNSTSSGVRGASSTQPQRVAPSGTGTVREMPVPQGVVPGRIPVRSGTSPSSSSRRKMVRHLDGRNQSNDPPPPH